MAEKMAETRRKAFDAPPSIVAAVNKRLEGRMFSNRSKPFARITRPI
jgi:hypothetical protein